MRQTDEGRLWGNEGGLGRLRDEGSRPDWGGNES